MTSVELVRGACAAINPGDACWLVAHADRGIKLQMSGVAGVPVR